MKLDWNKKYTTIAVYAFLVAAAIVALITFLWNFEVFRSFMQKIGGFVTPFVYGGIFAYLLNPLLKLLERHRPLKLLKPRMRRNLAILLSYLFVFCLIVLLIAVVVPTIEKSVTMVRSNMNYYAETVQGLVESVRQVLDMDWVPDSFTTAIYDALNNFLNYLYKAMDEILANIIMYVFGVTTRVGSGILNIVVGMIVSIYLLSSKEGLFAQCRRILHILFPKKVVDEVLDLTHDSNRIFAGFLGGKLIDSLIIGIICLICMYIFRMPYPELISLIVGVTNIIPYFGPIIGCVPGFLLILITGNVGQALGFLVFILVLQQVDGNIIGPAILGQSTGLSAIWVMFAILFFGGLYGFVGMIIGVPLLSIIFGVLRTFSNRRLAKKGLPTEVKDYASVGNELIE